MGSTKIPQSVDKQTRTADRPPRDSANRLPSAQGNPAARASSAQGRRRAGLKEEPASAQLEKYRGGDGGAVLQRRARLHVGAA